MDFKASGDCVIVEPLDPPEKIGGVFIPEDKQEEIRQRPIGMVTALGPKVNVYRAEQGDEALELNDVILFDKRGAGIVQGLDTKFYIYLRAPQVYAVITRDPHATKAEVDAARERGEKVNACLEGAAAVQSRPRRIVAAAGMPPPPSGPHLAQ